MSHLILQTSRWICILVEVERLCIPNCLTEAAAPSVSRHLILQGATHLRVENLDIIRRIPVQLSDRKCLQLA
jgi:hypothetical protein